VRYLIEHESVLRFGAPVREHHWELRLAPRDSATVRVLGCRVTMTPDVELRDHVDCFGNRVHRGSLMAPHSEVAARLVAEVETRLENPFAYLPVASDDEGSWLERRLREEPSLHDYLAVPADAFPALETLDGPKRAAGRPLLESLQETMAWAKARFRYEAGATAVHAPLAEFVARGAGVCQDFAHLLVALVRSWGIPARYVAGYVDPGANPEAGVETTHAWAEVLVPGAGWRGFDATHGLVVNELYVPAAVGRDSRDAAPVRGTFKGDAHDQSPEVLLRVARQEQ
jgi:transglutaminase-like putative cysteine protease